MKSIILLDMYSGRVSIVQELWPNGRIITDVYIDGDWFTVDEVDTNTEADKC